MRYILLTGIAMCLVPSLTAQDRSRDRTSDSTRQGVRIFVNGERGLPRIVTMGIQRRARLGIGVNLEPVATDSLGAYVRSVTPGGPAARAGIRTGDVITRVGNDPLVAPRARRGQEESAPGARLLELAAALAPNDTVKLEYLRDGARKTVTLVAGDEPILGESGDDERTFVWRMPDGSERRAPLPELPRMVFEGLPGPGEVERAEVQRGTPGGSILLTKSPLADLELAPLNADLGGYFGATEGVLVVKAPAGSSLGLKGGDVILAVDGRKPATPNSLIRILRSYEADETFRLEILRQRRRETVTGSLGRGGRDE